MALLATKGKAPGVYIQEITIPGPIAGAATSIAAFVGPAETGPLFTPLELTNITQFNTLFGGYIDDPYRVFVTQYHLGDPCRHDPDAVLACMVPLNDRDVGVANVILDLCAQIIELLASLLQERGHWDTTDAG